MKNYLYLLLFTGILFSSCEKMKNNRAERRLEGTWELVKSEYGSEEVDLSQRKQTMTFYDSNDKEHFEEDIHYGLSVNTYDGFTFETEFKYHVLEKGKELNLYLEFNSPSEATMFALSKPTITKLTRSKLVYEGENPDGKVSKFTFNRIN
jgi:hypothetical protein